MKERLWEVLNVLLWVAVAVVAAWQFALPVGIFAAAVGTVAGATAGVILSRSHLRGYMLILAAVLGALFALAFRYLLVRSSGLASFLGPDVTYTLADMVLWLLLPGALVMGMESLARRRPALRAGQLALAGGVFAALFAAHREGFIDRPFSFVDPLWSRGLDPLGYFLLVGAGLAVVLALMLAKGAPGRRSLAGVLTIIVLLMGIFLLLPQGQLKNVVELHRVMGGHGKGEHSNKPKNGKEQQGKPSSVAGNRSGKSSSKDNSGLPDSFSDLSAQESNAPVAVVVFHSDFKPRLGYFYFRETAYSTYNGDRLVRDMSGKYDRDVADAFGAGTLKLPSAGLPYSASVIPGIKGKAFSHVPTTVALLAPHPRPFGLVNPAEFEPARNPDPRRFFRAYSVLSSAFSAPLDTLFTERAGGKGWGSAAWRHYTQGPTDPRYGELADRIVSGLPEKYRDDPFARAVAIKLWLDKHGTYSLTSHHDQTPDPVADFLFGNLTGHCVYFANAACLLYRAAGVPSRVAGGYAVRASYMGGGSSLLIRARDAHAWPEICLKETGWIPLDIAPAKSLAPPEEAPDQGLQRLLGGMAMKFQSPPHVPPEEKIGPSPWMIFKHWLKILLWSLLILLGALIPIAYAVKMWRRWIPYAGGRRLPVTAYRASLDLLSEAGLRRGYGEAREVFASRVKPSSPSFEDLTARHLRHVLGPRLHAREAGRWLALYKAVRHEVKKGAGPARRCLRALNPIPWWKVH